MDGRGQEPELEIPELLILTQMKEMMKYLNQLEFNQRLSTEVMAIVGPLRATKYLDIAALQQLHNTLNEFAGLFEHADAVPRVAVGWFYFAFSGMVTEAAYAKDRQSIEIAAWEYLECVEKVFGPDFEQL